MMPSPRRLFILLALLPQLLVLGLGRGVVLCVAPDGHVQIEVAASTCCADALAASPEDTVGSEQEADECGSCTDLQIVVDTRVSRAPDGTDVDSGPSAALPVETSDPFGRGQSKLAAHRWVQSDLEPHHLIHLRSVLLRC